MAARATTRWARGISGPVNQLLLMAKQMLIAVRQGRCCCLGPHVHVCACAVVNWATGEVTVDSKLKFTNLTEYVTNVVRPLLQAVNWLQRPHVTVLAP